MINSILNWISNKIDDCDFGRLNIVPSRYIPKARLIVYPNDMLAVAYLRPPVFEPVAKVADSMRGAVLTELTLEYLNELTMGRLYRLATA